MRAGIAALLLAGCAAVPESGPATPVSFRALMAEVADTPYECTGYDPATDSCEAISTYAVSGDRVVNAGAFLISEDPRVLARGELRLTIEGDRLCGNLGATRLSFEGLSDPAAEDFIRDATSSIMGQLGEVCARYTRLGEGRYLADYDHADGEPLSDAQEDLHFFAAPKRLRMAN